MKLRDMEFCTYMGMNIRIFRICIYGGMGYGIYEILYIQGLGWCWDFEELYIQSAGMRII